MIINNQHMGDLVTTEDTIIKGIVTGTVTVTSNTKIYVDGFVAGDMLVDTGGAAVINGTVAGNILNRSNLEVNGVIDGVLLDPFNKAVISANAIINNRNK